MGNEDRFEVRQLWLNIRNYELTYLLLLLLVVMKRMLVVLRTLTQEDVAVQEEPLVARLDVERLMRLSRVPLLLLLLLVMVVVTRMLLLLLRREPVDDLGQFAEATQLAHY